MSTLPVPPYDKLDTKPFSAYPTVDLTGAAHPEISKMGLGRRGLLPQALFFVTRWLDFGVGDYLGLRIGDLSKPIVSTNVVIKQDQYPLFVDGLAIPEGDQSYFARVVRVGSGNESRSETQTMLFKKTIPGGRDRNPYEPWHSGLFMSLRDFKEGDALTPENIAEAGGLVCLIQPYRNIRKNDAICVYVDGILYEHFVSPEEAKQTGPIVVTVPVETVLNITENGSISVVFTVKDVVGNVPEGKYLFSKPIFLISEMDYTLLPFPLVLVDGDVVSQIDLDFQSAATMQVVVSLPFNRTVPKPLHKVIVIVQTADQNGVTETVRLDPVDDRNRRGETIPLPNSLVKKLAGGRFRVSFEWETAGGVPLGLSSSTLVYVVGTPTLMPALTLFPYQLGHVPPKTDVEARLPEYFPHFLELAETVIFEHRDASGGGQRVPFLQQAGPQGGTRQIPKEKLAVFEGKGVCQAFYETNDGKGTAGSIRQSEKLDFEIGERVATLPLMYVPAAEGGNIDPAKVLGKDFLMYVTYSDSLKGDIVSWSVLGKDPQSGSEGTITVEDGFAGEDLLKLGIPVDKEILLANLGGSLQISYSVERPGSPPVLQSMVLDITVGVPVVLGLLNILEAEPDQTLAPRHVTNGATLRISYTSMREDDQIAYEWDGEYDVSQFEGVEKGNPATNSIDVKIPAEVIAKGIRPGGNNITVDCTVKRGLFVYTFAKLYVQLLPLAKYPTPYIDGLENSSVLPVSSLDANANIKIPVWLFMLVGQPMWLTVTGTKADGTAYTKDLFIAKEVTADHIDKGVSLPLPLDEVRGLKDGTPFKIELWVSLPGIPDKRTAIQFGVATYIVQQLAAVLPYPTLNGASGTGDVVTVDPLSIQGATHVTIKYAGMLVTDSITLNYIFANGTVVSKVTPGHASGSVVVDLTAEKVMHNSVGSRVQLKYSILRNGKVTPSNVQAVDVLPIAPASLRGALINNLASGAALTMNTFSGDAKASVPAWPLIKAGQTVYLSLVSGGRELKVLNGYVVSTQEVTSGIVGTPVLRSWLQRVIHNTPITVKLSVGFGGSTDMARATPFLTTTYPMLNLPDFTNFQDGTLNGWELGTAGEGGAITGAPESRVWTQTTGSGLSQYKGYVLIKRITPLPGQRYRLSFAVRQLNVGTTTPKLRLTVGYSTSATFAVSSGDWKEYSHTAVNNGEDHFAVHSDESTWNGNDFQIAWLRIEKI